MGEAWVSCCPTCPPHSPTPLLGEWGRQAWSVGPAGAECSSAGSWAPSRQSESVLVMGRGPGTGTVTACSRITIGLDWAAMPEGRGGIRKHHPQLSIEITWGDPQRS